MGRSGATSEEWETVIQWSRKDELLNCWTSDPGVEKLWRKSKWPVRVAGRGKQQEPRSWEVRGIPKNRLIFRPMPGST